MFYIEDNNKILLVDEDKQRLQNTIAFMPQYEGLEIKEVKEGCVIHDFKLMTVEEMEEKQAQKERERLGSLKMTPRDFLLAITQMGVDFAKIKELMAANPQVEIELNYCNYVYRGNALLDQLCGQFGITTTQLDELFKSKGS